MKKTIILAIAIVCLLFVVSCGDKNTIRMSLDKVGEEVVHNVSMTGVSGIIGDNIKTVIDFGNDDPLKMKYITNTYRYGESPASNVSIVKGRYYEAMAVLEGRDVCRGIIVFLEFENPESATGAADSIRKSMNRTSSPDGVFKLGLTGIVQNKNDLMVYYLMDDLAERELSRVFASKDYVK